MNAQPSITRSEEQRLYAYLRTTVDDDALRYEMIARKIQRAADGTGNAEAISVTNHWLRAMREDEAAPAAQLAVKVRDPNTGLDGVRLGKAGNDRYQQFLDTLESPELEAIKNNAPYIIWVGQRLAEATASNTGAAEYIAQWSKANLSERVKAAILGLQVATS